VLTAALELRDRRDCPDELALLHALAELPQQPIVLIDHERERRAVGRLGEG
jgi:acetyl-CoA carboxylase alpha subunit